MVPNNVYYGRNGHERDRKVERSVAKQVYFGLLTNFSSLAPSMSLGFSAVTLALTSPSNPFALTLNQFSWFAAAASLATPIGCIVSGPIADRFGRKTALATVNMICLIGWLIIASASHFPHHQYPILLVGRLFTGLSMGLASMPPTIYMAEIASPNLRGVFCTWSSVSFSIGVLIVYVMGYILKDAWGTIALMIACFPVFGATFSIFLVPESPSWLISKNRLEQAKRNMCKIFGVKNYTPEVQAAIEDLVRVRGPKPGKKRKTILDQAVKKVKHLLKPTCLRPFALVGVFFFFQQFSGIYAIVFYAPEVVESAGVTLDAYAISVVIGAVRVVASILLSYICKYFGRRPLSTFSGLGMALSMMLLALYVMLLKHNTISSIPILPLALLLIYFFTSTLGFLPLPFAMAPEVFPNKVRGTASGLLVALAYFFNFITVKTFLSMEATVGAEGVFFIYGTVALVGTIFVTILLPETKGKTLEEIQQLVNGKKPSLLSDTLI